MAKHKYQFDRDFTVISNVLFRDKRLSYRAKGLFAQIVSLPDEWDFSLAGLATLAQDGVDAVRSTVKELEEAGYLEWVRERNDKGVFRVVVLIKLPGQKILPQEQPTRIEPQGIEPSGVKSHNKELKNKELKNKESKCINTSNSAELDRFHDFVCELFGKDKARFKLTPMRKQKLKLRLKELGDERLRQAFQNIAASAFHRGDNDRGWKIDDDPYWLVSNAEKAEKWSNKTSDSANTNFDNRQVSLAELRERGLL